MPFRLVLSSSAVSAAVINNLSATDSDSCVAGVVLRFPETEVSLVPEVCAIAIPAKAAPRSDFALHKRRFSKCPVNEG